MSYDPNRPQKHERDDDGPYYVNGYPQERRHSYDLSAVFRVLRDGRIVLADPQVGRIYFETERGNIYKIDTRTHQVVDIATSIAEGRVVTATLSQDTCAFGRLARDESFLISTEEERPYNTSPVQDIIVVRDGPAALNYGNSLPNDPPYEIVAAFERIMDQLNGIA